jgi:hypothetical protein
MLDIELKMSKNKWFRIGIKKFPYCLSEKEREALDPDFYDMELLDIECSFHERDLRLGVTFWIPSHLIDQNQFVNEFRAALKMLYEKTEHLVEGIDD